MDTTLQGKTPTPVPFVLRLNVLLYQEEGVWVGHCMEFDLVATAATQEEAFKEASELTKLQLQYAAEKEAFTHLLRPANPEIFKRMLNSVQDGHLSFTISKRSRCTLPCNVQGT